AQATLGQHLGGAARGGNLLRSLPAEFVRPYREILPDIAARQHLDRLAAAVHETPLPEELRRDHGARLEPLGERIEIHHRVLRPEGAVKAALRDAPMQRHLAALEAALELEPGARFRALVPPAGLGALARAVPATDPLPVFLRPFSGLQIAQIHRFPILDS